MRITGLQYSKEQFYERKERYLRTLPENFL
jgi:hypothetical protein